MVGAGPVRQPANAWSSLGVTLVGMGLIGTRRRHLVDPAIGWAAVAAGIAAFWYHADLTAAAARADGLGVAALLALIAVREWWQRVPPPAASAAAILVLVGAAAAGTPAVTGASIGFGTAAAAGMGRPTRRRDRDRRLAAATAILLVLGAAAWVLGRSGGPLCDPAAPVTVHALWHLLAATGLGCGMAYLRSGRTASHDSGSALRS
jgi:hypothetical protein